MTRRRCKLCKKPFDGPKCKIYCSDKCRADWNQQLANDGRNYKWGGITGNGETITHSSSGAIGELVVAAKLLAHNWTVFRAVSPASFVDIVAVKGPRRITIEVRKGDPARQFTAGIGDFSLSRGRQGKRSTCDVYAAVLPDGICFVLNDGTNGSVRTYPNMDSLDVCLKRATE